MIVIGYCSTWINGVCEKPGKDSREQESSVDSFRRLLQRCGNAVVSVSTLRFMQAQQFDLDKSRVVVLEDSAPEGLPGGVSHMATAPEAIAQFAISREQALLVGGDARVVSTFLKQQLVQELIVDFEPGLTSEPSSFVLDLNRSLSLHLIGIRKIGAATMQFHYRLPQSR
jgi:hypothetical protein